jgi:ribonuclease HIII
VAQKTLVLQVPLARAREIQRALAAGAFEFRPTPHALFSAKGEGVVATQYNSGKLVIQGEHPEAFAALYVGAAGVPQAARAPEHRDEAVVGSDETGKGDYFGPLVVVAVRLEPELSSKLAGGDVRDSKTLTDEHALRLGASLRAKLPHAIQRLDPSAYNAEHARVKNLNPLLAGLHARAIRELATPGVRVVVDQFANEKVLEQALGGIDIQLEQRPRGEEVLAVAAASVIAREQFLTALRELSDAWAIDLTKGAGDPADRAARRFVALHGFDKLGNVAKLHFKNTQKIAGARAS